MIWAHAPQPHGRQLARVTVRVFSPPVGRLIEEVVSQPERVKNSTSSRSDVELALCAEGFLPCNCSPLEAFVDLKVAGGDLLEGPGIWDVVYIFDLCSN